MEIKWYWPAEMLGLVEDVTHLYPGQGICYEVSAKTDEVFAAFALGMMPFLMIAGALWMICFVRKNKEHIGQKRLHMVAMILVGYGVLSVIGVGPYIQFYPSGGGFIDFSFLEHLAQGVYLGILAGCLWLGGKLGKFYMGKKGWR